MADNTVTQSVANKRPYPAMEQKISFICTPKECMLHTTAAPDSWATRFASLTARLAAVRSADWIRDRSRRFTGLASDSTLCFRAVSGRVAMPIPWPALDRIPVENTSVPSEYLSGGSYSIG